MAHVAQWKKDEVKELKKLIEDYPVVGVVNIGSVPGKQIQTIRSSVRGDDTKIKMSRKRLMKLALKKSSKEGVTELAYHITGQAGLIFSNINPFKIYSTLERNKTKAAAKANSIAPADISVSQGPTSFPPGPILSELQMGGIPAAIQAGKVAIKQDTLVVKAGDKISPATANALARLEIEPIEIKLELLAAFEDGTTYTPDILAVDADKIRMNIATAYQQAVNLSVNSAYLTKQTAAIGITQAVSKARNLAINAEIFEKEVIDIILAKALAKANALDSLTREKVKSAKDDKSEE